MTRTILAASAVVFALAALFSSSAEACISCNYTPEVVNTPVGPQKARKAARREKVAPPARNSIAKRPPVREPVEAAKEREAPKDVATGKEATPPDAEADAGGKSSGSATAALTEHEAAKAEQPKAESAVGCKKYSAAVGATVTVPCE